MTTTITPSFTAGGLASGLDSNSIIDSLVAANSAPLNSMKFKQQGLQAQVSAVGNLSSLLSAINTAVQKLNTGGVRSVAVASGNLGFTATTGSSASASRSSIQVEQLAAAAKLRSQGFASGTSAVRGGAYHLGVQGTNYDLTVADGTSLSDLATQINALGAPVVASVISDGTKSYLSIANQNTGFAVGGDASQALTLSADVTGSQGMALTTSVTSTAKNAKLNIDNLEVERQTNEVADVIPGATLSLKAVTALPEDLVLTDDPTGTATNLTSFISAYNTLAKAVQAQLNVSDTTSRGATLAGDSSVRSMQQALQTLVSKVVSGNGAVRTLADLGVKTERDGTLTLDSARLTKALAADPSAVNNIVSNRTDGLAVAFAALTTHYTNAEDGIFTARQSGINSSLKDLSKQEEVFQTRLDALRANLLAQFSAMEKLVSSLKSTGAYLTSLQNAQKSA